MTLTRQLISINCVPVVKLMTARSETVEQGLMRWFIVNMCPLISTIAELIHSC